MSPCVNASVSKEVLSKEKGAQGRGSVRARQSAVTVKVGQASGIGRKETYAEPLYVRFLLESVPSEMGKVSKNALLR